MDWQPIDTAPKDGTRVLLWNVSGRYGIVEGWYAPTLPCPHWTVGHGDLVSPTFWMPLPPPPAPSQES